MIAATLAHSKITMQGQISVPAEIRRKLGIGPGSVLEWNPKGSAVIVRRAARYTSEDLHLALFKKLPQHRSLTKLKEGIRKHMKHRHARS
jgi:AbrB family looped-hinge helix DNA binding protein